MPFGLMSARFTTMLALIAAMLMTVDAAFATESSIDSSTVTVKVTGYGASVSEARADAVRQAMQRTLSQLVVSVVEVNQDKVLRDRVMSTMNGFVEKVQEHSVRREGDEIVISSSITVSTKRMTNFLGLQSKAANVDGLSLFSELNRESEQREIVAEILARTFRGFPSETIETTVTSIKPAADNPDEFIIEFTAGFRKEWIRSLEDTLKALAVSSFEFNISDFFGVGSIEKYLAVESWPSFNYYNYPNLPQTDRKLQEFYITQFNTGSVKPLCIFSGSKVHCYALPKGNYKDALKFEGFKDKLGFIIAATNKNGESTMLTSCCQIYFHDKLHYRTPLFNINMFPITTNEMGGNYGKISGVVVDSIYADNISQSIRVNRTSFNLPQTRKLLILPVYMPAGHDWIASRKPLLDTISSMPVTEESVMKAAREAALQK